MLKFSYLCELLEKLENVASHDPPFSPKERRDREVDATISWFKSYRRSIDSIGPDEASALLSALLPHLRKDRIYGLQCATLLKILGRCLTLSASKRNDLTRYKLPGNGDLASCVERVLKGGGPPALPPVTLLEVDLFLHETAASNRFSGPHVRHSSDSTCKGVDEERLKQILQRLTPTESKWLIRLILKDFSPVILDDSLVLCQFHFLLPDLLKMHNDIGAACKLLKRTFHGYPSQPDRQSRVILRQTAGASLQPLPGVMVARSEFCKARSIKHCLQMTSGQKWLVDRKYDGEYCQIHVNLEKGHDWLTIYSKSGRDSTEDRQTLRNTISKCLRIGSRNCQIKRHCILVGEMVPYSEADHCIISFDNIRKHVPRAGIHLGAAQDSPIPQGEHLMIVFFDLLLLDDENIINKPIEQRKAILRRLYKKIDGHAMSAESALIDFGSSDSKRKLMHQFAATNALPHEGLVLNPCGVPYFSFLQTSTDGSRARTIKLKKDYIAGLGDEADFAVIGASYKAQEANKRPDVNLAWTHFHLGCVMNDTDLVRSQAMPVFKIVATIAMDHCIPLSVLLQINAEGKFLIEKPPSGYTVQYDRSLGVDVFFRKPFVFEVLGSSYSKPSDAGFFMLRHPRVKKMHGDRSWRDCITFDQLQNAAREAVAVPADTESLETLGCLTKLEASCKRKFSQISCTTTPTSAASILTPRSKNKRGNIDAPRIYEDPVDSSPLVRMSRLQRPAGKMNDNRPMPTPPRSSPRPILAPSIKLICEEETCATSTGSQTYKRRSHEVINKENIIVRSPDSEETAWISASRAGKECVAGGHSQPGPTDHVTPKPILPSIADQVVASDEDGDLDHAKSKQSLSRRTSKISASKISASTDTSVTVREILNPQDSGSIDRKPNLADKIAVYVDDHGISDVRDVVNLLRLSCATIVADLKEWNRDSYAYGLLGATVSESQSFPGLQKVALVDSRNTHSLLEVVSKILSLNGGHFREEVDILDYRLVESARQAQSTEKIGQHFRFGDYIIGKVMYDSLADRAVFVPHVRSSAVTTRQGVA